MTTHNLFQGSCPSCGTLFSGVTNVDESDERPKPGDLSVCRYCAELLIFREAEGGVTVDRPTRAEIEELDGTTKRALMAALAAVLASPKAPPSGSSN